LVLAARARCGFRPSPVAFRLSSPCLLCSDVTTCNGPFNGAYEGKCEISINRFATTHSGPDEILKLGLYDPD
jgi:hypothetical protein